MKLEKYSIGVGDRFSHQAEAQLAALVKAREQGVLITPVWNKSYREHQLIGSNPRTTREQADQAVKNLSWHDSYFVDADHINMKNVDFFLADCDFFTIDVADAIGKSAAPDAVQAFVELHARYSGQMRLPGLNDSIRITPERVRQVTEKYLFAAQQAGEIYRHIRANRAGLCVIEVSMDETDQPQTPLEIFFILAALADQKIPVQTIAPKFSGRFNKGVDYAGRLALFQAEFEQDIVILKMAMDEFDLPPDLKISIHSGSDKFSIYPVIRQIIRRHDTGLHLKTAGTTWLEELIGLAEGGSAGFDLAKRIYLQSLEKFEELCEPYASVIDIDRSKLPSQNQVEHWDGLMFCSSLRHDPGNKNYNPHFRQLLHVGYKIAAREGDVFLNALTQYRSSIARNVTANLYDRHIKPLYLD